MTTIDDTLAQEIWYARVACERSSLCDHKICHICRRGIRNTIHHCPYNDDDEGDDHE